MHGRPVRAEKQSHVYGKFNDSFFSRRSLLEIASREDSEKYRFIAPAHACHISQVDTLVKSFENARHPSKHWLRERSRAIFLRGHVSL
jgi:hypothetical protein